MVEISAITGYIAIYINFMQLQNSYCKEFYVYLPQKGSTQALIHICLRHLCRHQLYCSCAYALECALRFFAPSRFCRHLFWEHISVRRRNILALMLKHQGEAHPWRLHISKCNTSVVCLCRLGVMHLYSFLSFNIINASFIFYFYCKFSKQGKTH